MAGIGLPIPKALVIPDNIKDLFSYCYVQHFHDMPYESYRRDREEGEFPIGQIRSITIYDWDNGFQYLNTIGNEKKTFELIPFGGVKLTVKRNFFKTPKEVIDAANFQVRAMEYSIPMAKSNLSLWNSFRTHALKNML